MSGMPSETWKEVAVEVWGPLHTGEYVLVVVCEQSIWADVEFVTSTSARAVILKLDRMNPNYCAYRQWPTIQWTGFQAQDQSPFKPAG